MGVADATKHEYGKWTEVDFKTFPDNTQIMPDVEAEIQRRRNEEIMELAETYTDRMRAMQEERALQNLRDGMNEEYIRANQAEEITHGDNRATPTTNMDEARRHMWDVQPFDEYVDEFTQILNQGNEDN